MKNKIQCSDSVTIQKKSATSKIIWLDLANVKTLLFSETLTLVGQNLYTLRSGHNIYVGTVSSNLMEMPEFQELLNN